MLAGSTDLTLDVSQFTRQTGGATLRVDAVRAKAVRVGDRVRLTLCVNHGTSSLGDPGSYAGSISIIDPRIARVDLPLEVTIAWPYWPGALLLCLLAILAGTFVAWVVRAKPSEDSHFKLSDFLDWVARLIGVVTVAVGTVAALTAYAATYLGNPVWGSSSTDVITLLGACFTAFVGTTTSLQLATLAQAAVPVGPAAPGRGNSEGPG